MRKSRDGRYASKVAKTVAKAVKSYDRRVAAFNAARAEVDAKRHVAADSADVHAIDAELAVEAANLRDVRETLVKSCKTIGLGFDLPEVVT